MKIDSKLLKDKNTVTPSADAPQGIRTIAIPLTTLTLDPRLQPRAHEDKDLVSEYADAMHGGATFPPIRVIADTENHHWLVDGWHRVTAAKRAKRIDLPAEVSGGTFEEAEDYVLTVNRTHGLRRTQADVQNAIRRALNTQRWVKRSDNWIGKHIGCSDKTVSALRQHLESTSEIPKLKKLLGEDGKERLRPKPKPTPKPTTEWPVTARAPRSDTPATPPPPATSASPVAPPTPTSTEITIEPKGDVAVEPGGCITYGGKEPQSAAATGTVLTNAVMTCVIDADNALKAIQIQHARYTDAERQATVARLKEARDRIGKLYDLVDDALDTLARKVKTA